MAHKKFLDINLKENAEWKRLCRAVSDGDPSEIIYKGNLGFEFCYINNGFKNEVFSCMPYYSGEDGTIKRAPNFVYFPTDLEIYWSKHPYVKAYANQPISDAGLAKIFKRCYDSVRILSPRIWDSTAPKDAEFYPGDSIVVSDNGIEKQHLILDVTREIWLDDVGRGKELFYNTILSVAGDVDCTISGNSFYNEAVSKLNPFTVKYFKQEGSDHPTWNVV